MIAGEFQDDEYSEQPDWEDFDSPEEGEYCPECEGRGWVECQQTGESLWCPAKCNHGKI